MGEVVREVVVMVVVLVLMSRCRLSSRRGDR